MEKLKAWYLAQTKPQVVNFQTMFIASLLAKGNILMAQIVGGTLVAAALLLGDSADGAFNKFMVWQFFVVALCALSARNHRYFSFVELDQGYNSIVDRLILTVMNFFLVWQWASTFLHPSFGLLVSVCYGIFSFFLFAPRKTDAAMKA